MALSGKLIYTSFLLVCLFQAQAQTKKTYTLQVTSFAQGEKDTILLLATEKLRFNFGAAVDPYEYDNSVSGRLVMVASLDSLLSADDKVVLDSVCTLKQFTYGEKSIRHNLKGFYYLLTTFYAKDANTFEKQSNTVGIPVQFVDVTITMKTAWLSHIKTTYNYETSIHLDVNLDVSCCTNYLGSFSGEWEVGLATRPTATPKIITSFYRTDTLNSRNNLLVLEQTLWNEVILSKFNFITLRLKSAYFTENYRQLPEWFVAVPFKVITDVEELNAQKRKQYPFLTYGSFDISDHVLQSMDVDSLYEEAKVFYSLVQSAVESIQLRDPDQALKKTDSAFAFAGRHRMSSLLFVQPSIVSDLYSGLINWKEAHNLFGEKEKSELSFRLGEAMKMSDLMQKGYEKLIAKILPDTLDMLNEMEQSGFYEKRNSFNSTNITELPVLWRERTVPALEHFTRVVNFEDADKIIAETGKHVSLVQPIWKLISEDTLLAKHFNYLGNSVSESNDMLDFELARLQYYSQTGLYEQGDDVVQKASHAFACSYQFDPVTFWKAAANFYESLGAYEKADSLFALCDDHIEREILNPKRTDSQKRFLELKMNNKELLKAKLGESFDMPGNALAEKLETIRKDPNAIFNYMDLLSDRNLAQKLGFLGSSIYDNFYWNQIEQLNEQNQYFLANEWMKELAFLLGREGRSEQAITLYQNLFIIDNLKAMAFRLGFSEEAQLFFFQKQQATFSRFLNVVLNNPASDPEKAAEILDDCLRQALFHHAFILRGNYRLLYDINRSKDPQVERLQILWQTLREYLNDLYVKGDPDKAGMNLMKEEIANTEKELIRIARDTSSMRLDYILPTDSLRALLQDGEAAIEIVRFNENDKVYYGSKVGYGALIVKKNGPVELVRFPVEGALMENRHYKMYRNSIQFKLHNESSHSVYWEPLVASLKNIKKIYWAPDGVFHLINLNTLFNPATQKYLVDEYEIQTVPTISQIKKEVPISVTSATVLGNPLYSDDESRAKKGDTIRTSRELFRSQAIARLPGTKTEAETITNLLGSSNARVVLLTNGDASKQELFKNNQSDVLHLATHGFWIDKPKSESAYHSLYETLANSGIVLAYAQKHLETGGYSLLPQGILTSAEIQDMNLFRTKLVVLSACETGLGEVVPGEGLYGLKRALQKAGVQNLVTSLWKVDDAATMEFMTTFYESLVKTQHLSGSFRQAMISLKEKFPEPYYWGAFVLTSN